VFKINLRRRCLLPRFWKLPRVDLPRVRVDFPQEVPPPWREIAVERVLLAPLARGWFILKVIF